MAPCIHWGIERLCYCFTLMCGGSDPIVSMRHFPRHHLVVSLTASGRAREFGFCDADGEASEWSTMSLETLVRMMKRALEETTSDWDKVLGWGLLWLLADAFGLLYLHESMLHNDASMFGVEGKDAIIDFKSKLLGNGSKDRPNYAIDSIHEIDVTNRVIVADFECLIEGYEGRGTDVPKFDADMKIVRVEAMRHSVSYFKD